MSTKNLTLSKYNNTTVNQLAEITSPKQELIIPARENLTDYTVTVLHGNLDIENPSLYVDDIYFRIVELPQNTSLNNYRSYSGDLHLNGSHYNHRDFLRKFTELINNYTIGDSPYIDLGDDTTHTFTDPITASTRLLDFSAVLSEEGYIDITHQNRLTQESNYTLGYLVSYSFYQKFLSGFEAYLVRNPDGTYIKQTTFAGKTLDAVVLKPFALWDYSVSPHLKEVIMNSTTYDASKFYNWSRVMICSDTLPVPSHLFYQEGTEYLQKMPVISSILINSEALEASRKLLYIPDTLREVSLDQNYPLYNVSLSVYIQYENGRTEKMIIRPTTSISIQLQFKKRNY